MFPGLDFIVDRDRSAIAQLEHSRSDDFISRIHTRDHRDLIASRTLDLNELLSHSAIRFAFRILEIGNHEDRIAIRGIVDSGRWQSNHRAVGSNADIDLDEHARAQLALRISESGLHLNVPRGLVNHGIESCDLSRKNLARNIFRRHVQIAADSHLPGRLLGYAEIHINRIQRLQRSDSTARGKILPQVHLADAEGARKRSSNHFALNRGPDLSHIRFGSFLLSGRLIELQARNDAGVDQLLFAAKVHAREFALRFERCQLGPFLLGVENNQYISGMHRLA